jgi:hypothetical protein
LAEGIFQMDTATTKIRVSPHAATISAEPLNLAVSDDLLVKAQGIDREQQALMETATDERATYPEMLELYIQSKQDQVGTLEDQLESLIAQQQSQLQQSQANRPSLLALPKTKQAWATQQTQQQARLMTLQTRLESVRELKDGMGLHSPKLEELAEHKLRKHDPALVEGWDSALETQRSHQAMLRKQAQDKNRVKKVGNGLSLGLKN